MGCGKSTVAGMLAEAGFLRIDSDALVKNHVLTNPDERVFASEADRLWLEEMTHPRVFDYWRGQLEAAPKANWVIEVPLLFEKQLENWFDFIVCVACSPAQQLARLEQKGLPGPLAEQRISKQLPLAHKTEHSDFVLWNDGSTEFLRAQVASLIDALPKTA